MNTTSQTVHRVIPPELVAQKLSKLKDGWSPSEEQFLSQACPRFPELAMFIQGYSVEHGLAALARYLVSEFPDRLGTPTMRSAKGSYTLSQKLALYHELPFRVRPSVVSGDNALWEILSDLKPGELPGITRQETQALEAALVKYTPETLAKACERAAIEHLPRYFVSLCTEERAPDDEGKSIDDEEALSPREKAWHELSETWYFDDVLGALVDLMDRHARKVAGTLAMTAVAREVFDTAERTLATGTPSVIRGDPRFGKTEATKAICAMYPGRLRWIAVPQGNSLREFFIRIADALGIDTSYGSGIAPLRAKIQYIFRQTDIVPVFDEGAWLLPESYSKTTQPARLNWVRSELLDKGIPAIVVVTPQWFDEPLEKFVSTTHYAVEQFLGRCEITPLPSHLEQGDLLRVAAFHFPEFKRKADLLEITEAACRSDGYLKTFEQLSKRARFVAQTAGVPVSMDIVREVIEKRFPRPTALVDRFEEDSAPAAVQVGRISPGARNNEPLSTPSRAVKLGHGGGSTEPFSGNRSLRGAGPERMEAELISADS
jgi:hypothetical protein